MTRSFCALISVMVETVRGDFFMSVLFIIVRVRASSADVLVLPLLGRGGGRVIAETRSTRRETE